MQSLLTSKKFLPVYGILGLFILIGLAWAGTARLTGSVDASDGGTTGIYRYSVKVVCTPALGKPKPALVPAAYRTAVNFLNSSPHDTKIWKALTLSVPQGSTPIWGDPVEDTLRSRGALDIDCIHLAREFGLQGIQVPGGKGFLIIESDQELTVVAVYTSRKITKSGGAGQSIDVEYVDGVWSEERILSGGAGSDDLPDLTIRLPLSTSTAGIPPAPVPTCHTGPGSCTLRVSFQIANIGPVDAVGPFDIEIIADGYATPFITTFTGVVVGGGGVVSQVVTIPVTIAPADGCYDPNCTIDVTADSGGVIDELDETNNSASETYGG